MNVTEKQKRSFKEVLKDIDLKAKIKNFFYEIFTHPLHLITHPIAGWDDFKREKIKMLCYKEIGRFAVISEV